MPGMPSRARLAERLEALELFRAVVDHQRLACLMVDARAKLFDASAAGAAVLETGNCLKLGAGGRVAGASAADTARLRALAKRAAHGSRGGSMQIRNELGGECAIRAIPRDVGENSSDPPRPSCACAIPR